MNDNNNDIDLLESFLDGDKEARHQAAERIFPDSTFNKVLDIAVSFARQALKEEKPRGLKPRAIIVGRNMDTGKHEHQVAVLGEMPDTRKEKDLVMETLAQQIIEKKGKDWPVVAIFLTTEAWSVKTTKDEFDPNMSVSQRADKEEVIATQGLTVDGRTCFSIDKIIRDRNGRIKGTSPYQYAPYAYKPDAAEGEATLLVAFFKAYAREATDDGKRMVGGDNIDGDKLIRALGSKARAYSLAEQLGKRIGGELGQKVADELKLKADKEYE